MKIAYLSTFYPFRGGITHFNNSLFKAFQGKYDIQAFTFKRQYPDILFPGKTQLVTEEDRIDDVGAISTLDTINPFSYLSTANKIKAYNPDILLMKYWMPYFAPSLGFVAGKLKKSGTNIIPILDNVIPHERKFYDIPFTRYFLKRCSGFLVMSETVKNDLLSLKRDAKFLEHAHPLYDHFGEIIDREKARKTLNLPPDKKILLFFGFIREYKGLDLLIESMKFLPDDYHLLIGGEVYGDEKKYYDLIDKHGVRNKITPNIRYIADDEVPLFFSASDLNVLPYRSATQSGILSIAYHFELPVLVTDTGSLKQAVEPHGTGAIIQNASPEHISKGILDFFNNHTYSDFKNNLRNYKKENSWEKLASSLIEFNNEL